MDDVKIIAVDFDGTLCYSDWPADSDIKNPARLRHRRHAAHCVP